jgi:hypothetical protein
MSAAHPNEQRSLTRCYESDPVGDPHLSQPEGRCRFPGEPPQLVFCHRRMRLVVDPGDLRAILGAPHHTPKIDNTASFPRKVVSRHSDR